MTVLEAVEARASQRNFADRAIEPEKLARILRAGALAPTASNEQRTKIIAVTDRDLRAQLVEACEEQDFVGQAPVVLVTCADQDRTMICGQSARTVDCTIAMAFMRLQAIEEGLQGCWLGWFHPEQIRAILNIPPEYIVVAVTPIGYPLVPAVRSYKKPIEELVFYNRLPSVAQKES